MGKIRVLVLLGVLVLVFGFAQVKEGKAGANDNIAGWAWSETIGWVSFNSTNCDTDADGTYEGANEAGGAAPAGCPVSGTVQSYGVNVNNATGVFSGYAWSEHIGWISFNAAELVGCPSGTCEAKLDFGTKKVSGWAKALAATGGWDGWIKLKGTTTDQSPYGVSWNSATGKLEGWAWGSDVVGWVSFSGANYKVSAGLDTTAPTVSVSGAPASWQNTDATAGVGCTDTGGSGCDSATYKLKAYTSSPPEDCPNAESDYTLANSQTVSSRKWFCAFGKDSAGNPDVSDSPVEFQVDKAVPSTAVTSPAAGTWFKDNFNATFDDSDTGGSNLVSGASGCQYRFIGDNPSGADISSGDLTRQCDPVTKNITVGSSPDVCRFEGQNRCRVSTKSFDVAGNDSGWQTVLYGVDFTDPIVGSPTPSSAQSGVSTNYGATLSDPIGKVTGCSFFWRTVGSSTWNTGAATTINPIPCENNADCTVSVDHTFASAGSYEAQFGCIDQATNTGWGGVTTVQVGSLSVDLSAVPPSGTVNTLFDLVATVSGTMTGNINYKFDCTNDGVWEREVNNSATNPYTAVDVCQYDSVGTYTAKVLAERGVGTAQDTADIAVSANSVPGATNLSVDAHNATDYCGVTGYPPVRVRWEFSDADAGDTQSAYELEVFKGADKVVATGKKSGATQSYVFQSGGEQLAWDTTYTWKVMVWDDHDDPSAFIAGPQFTTVVHHYPVPTFTWTPTVPSSQELVQFNDQTNFAAGSSSKTWSWNFGDAGTSTSQNPTHTYARTGAFQVTLQSGDNVGSCSTQKTVNVSIPFPEWQEISPF